MKDTEYVYCTHCKHFRLDDKDKPYCPYEDECDIWDCEDSRRFAERPKYEEIDNSLEFNIVGYSKDNKYLICNNGFKIGCPDGCSFNINKIKELAKSK